MANQRVYRPEAGSERGLDVNFALDYTPDDIHNELLPGYRRRPISRPNPASRPGHSRRGGCLQPHQRSSKSRPLTGWVAPLRHEKAVELNYALKVTRWFTFQPVCQYYFDTGANPLGHNSVAWFGLPYHFTTGFKEKAT